MFTKEPTRLTSFHVLDGVTFYLAETDENPDDDFTTNRFAKHPSIAQEPPGDED